MNKQQIIDLMIELEGGFVNRSDDPGGATKYGVTQLTLNSLRSKIPGLPQNVADLAVPQAESIYETVQWDQIRGDELSSQVALLAMNAAINMGTGTAIMLLQDAVGVKHDGVIGPQTLQAIASWKSPYMPQQTLPEEYAARIAVHYAQLYAGEAQFELGWMRRLLRVYTLDLQS